jgi:benzodiazapine receptor
MRHLCCRLGWRCRSSSDSPFSLGGAKAPDGLNGTGNGRPTFAYAARRRLTREGRAFQDIDYNRRGAAPGSSTPWASLLALIGFVGLSLLVGAANGAVTRTSSRTWYLSLTPPPGTPPPWTFPVVWTVLYIMMGLAAWLVWRRAGHQRPLRVWGWQLLANTVWPAIFFGLQTPGPALFALLALIVLIALTIRAFARVRPLAAGLMAPYLAWCTYAAYLNAGFWWLNAG